MNKTLWIHDLTKENAASFFDTLSAEDKVIDGNDVKKHCIGCFGCWTRTPGCCVITDCWENIPKSVAGAEKVVIVSRLVYGSYSPTVKRVLDRAIGYILPFFRIVNNEMHHQMRYDKPFELTVHFYGESILDREKDIALKLVRANGVNMGTGEPEVFFHRSFNEIKEALI